MPEKPFIISTDSSGIFGTPSKWNRVWGFVKSDPNFAGVEAIGWKWFSY